jgi:putative hydrolase of the HAD superfamily
VSNWDCSLGDWLEPSGLTGLVEAVVTSAVTGAAKPDPLIFRRALDLLGVEAARAVHVGDSLDTDVDGARAAGIRAVLIAREGNAPRGVEAVRSLEDVPSLL